MDINASFSPTSHAFNEIFSSSTSQAPAAAAAGAQDINLPMLMRDYRAFLMGRCRLLTRGNRDDANDLFSRVVLKLCSEPPAQMEQIRHLGGWLNRVAQNQFIDDQRERQASERRDDSLSYLSETCGIQAASPEQQYLNGELRRHLHQAFAMLPPRLRRAAHMRFQDEAPYKEIAEHLSISEANARKHIQEARKILIERLRGYVEGPSTPAAFNSNLG